MSGPGAPLPWGLRVRRTRRLLAACVCVGAQLLSAGAARASLAEDVGRLREIWRAMRHDEGYDDEMIAMFSSLAEQGNDHDFFLRQLAEELPPLPPAAGAETSNGAAP